MGVFDSILGFLNPEVISTYNDLVNRVFSLMFRKTSFKTPKILIKTRA